MIIRTADQYPMQIAVLMCSRNLVNCVWPTNRPPCYYSIMEQEHRQVQTADYLRCKRTCCSFSLLHFSSPPPSPTALLNTFKKTCRVWWSCLLLSWPFNGSLMRLLKAGRRFFGISVITALIPGCRLHKWPSASFLLQFFFNNGNGHTRKDGNTLLAAIEMN